MSELPTGTVTFLFTDLEGSTRLWEEQPEAMKGALARHDGVLEVGARARLIPLVKTMRARRPGASPRASFQQKARQAARVSLSMVAQPPLNVRVTRTGGSVPATGSSGQHRLSRPGAPPVRNCPRR